MVNVLEVASNFREGFIVFSLFSLSNIKAIAEECARQKSGEMSVSHLAAAVQYAGAFMRAKPLTVDSIENLGSIIEPRVNVNGFRSLPVFIDGKVAGINSGNIRHVLTSLCEAYNEGRILKAGLYQEFETVHPFADGNGRVGFVLYNLDNIYTGAKLQTPPMYRS